MRFFTLTALLGSASAVTLQGCGNVRVKSVLALIFESYEGGDQQIDATELESAADWLLAEMDIVPSDGEV